MLNPSFGVKLYVNPKAALNVSIGYRHQENSFDYYYYYYSATYKEKEHIINLKFGVTF